MIDEMIFRPHELEPVVVQDNTISDEDTKGEFRDLVAAAAVIRSSEYQIRLFRSMGMARHDLAATELAIRNPRANA